MRAQDALADMHRVEANILAAVRQALGQSASLAAQLARTSTKFRDHSARLRSSITRIDRDEWSIAVQAGGRPAPYAIFVEAGTRAHDIRPKLGAGFIGPARESQGRQSRGPAKPLLRWRDSGGRWHAAKLVKHPGTTATHFMQDARDQAEAALVRFVEIGLRSVAEG